MISNREINKILFDNEEVEVFHCLTCNIKEITCVKFDCFLKSNPGFREPEIIREGVLVQTILEDVLRHVDFLYTEDEES